MQKLEVFDGSEKPSNENPGTFFLDSVTGQAEVSLTRSDSKKLGDINFGRHVVIDGIVQHSRVFVAKMDRCTISSERDYAED